MNAVMGLVWLEFALWRSKRFRSVPEELDSQFPAWRRLDAKNWNRFLMYPGAMTVLIPKCIFMLLCVLVVAINCRAMLICHDLNKPIVGMRKLLLRMMFWVVIRAMAFFSFFCWVSHDFYDVDDPRVDYSKYLGPAWKQELKQHLL
jgi:hypothetical protein